MLTPSVVSLKIYNITGQTVRALIDKEKKSTGYFATVWDGKNRDGNSMPTGIYFCSLEIDGFKEIRKAIILR